MRKLSRFLVTAIALIDSSAAARVEFVVQHKMQRVAGAEVCFFKVAPSGVSPDRFWFFSSEVRCVPADQLIDIPVGRFRFFGRAPGLITPTDNLVINTEEQAQESYRQKVIDAVPSATADLSTLSLSPGQSFAILAGPGPEISGGLFPAVAGATSLQVPASVPLLPMIIENHVPLWIGDLLTIDVGARGRPVFLSKQNHGYVVTWIEFDRALAEQPRVSESKYGGIASHLITGAARTISPLFSIPNPVNAQGTLQIFSEVPGGSVAVVLDGDKWETSATSSVATPGAVVVTQEPLRAIPAAIIHVTYALESASVPIRAARRQGCASNATESVPPLVVTAYRCDNGPTAIEKFDASHCAISSSKTVPLGDRIDVRLARLPMGRYVIEARHPTLGIARKAAVALPNDELTVRISPPVFALFGRVTRGGAAVRAEIKFAQGTRAAGEAVADDEGRYEALLPGDPKDNPVEVKACNGSFEYMYFPRTPPLPNAAFDITVPSSSLRARLRDSETQEPVPNAVTFCWITSDNPEVGDYSLREVSTQEGLAEFAAVPANLSLKVCASAQPLGYTTKACTDNFHVAENEHRDIELLLTRTGKVRGRLVTPVPFNPAILALVNGGGVTRQRVTVDQDGNFWLRDQPSPNDFFVLTGPGQPLYVIGSWSSEDQTIVVAPPLGVRIRTVTIHAPNTEEKGRLIGIAIGGRHVPGSILWLHLANHGTNMAGAWPLVIPDLAESGPIAVTIGPFMAEFPSWIPEGTDLFTLPQFMTTYPTRIVPPDRDDLGFD